MSSKQPYNFSWLIEGVLAGSGYPQQREHFQFYLNQNIRHVISLTEWEPPRKIIPAGLDLVFLPVVEFEAPSLEQLNRFADIVYQSEKRKEAVVVHCHWGRGRTGTMLAAYLIRYRNMNSGDAIYYVRRKRPHSVETFDQEDILHDYGVFVSQMMQKYKKKVAANSAIQSQHASPASSTKSSYSKMAPYGKASPVSTMSRGSPAVSSPASRSQSPARILGAGNRSLSPSKEQPLPVWKGNQSVAKETLAQALEIQSQKLRKDYSPGLSGTSPQATGGAELQAGKQAGNDKDKKATDVTNNKNNNILDSTTGSSVDNDNIEGTADDNANGSDQVLMHGDQFFFKG